MTEKSIVSYSSLYTINELPFECVAKVRRWSGVALDLHKLSKHVFITIHFLLGDMPEL